MQIAPEFTLDDQNNVAHNLVDYRGKWIVLYFYPKDDGLGCTAEACSFRDARDDIAELGAEVIGISKDPLDSHQDFAARHKLNFALLSDPEMTVAKAYGAWGKKFFRHPGVLRKTFIINPKGEIVKAFNRVTPLGHGQRVAIALLHLQEAR